VIVVARIDDGIDLCNSVHRVLYADTTLDHDVIMPRLCERHRNTAHRPMLHSRRRVGRVVRGASESIGSQRGALPGVGYHDRPQISVVLQGDISYTRRQDP
jgi:hypothetical protein